MMTNLLFEDEVESRLYQETVSVISNGDKFLTLNEPEESLMLFDEETESEHYHIVVLVIRADMI